MGGIHLVAMRFERLPRCIQCLGRPAQIARGERHLGLRHDAAGAGHGLFSAEGAGRLS